MWSWRPHSSETAGRGTCSEGGRAPCGQPSEVLGPLLPEGALPLFYWPGTSQQLLHHHLPFIFGSLVCPHPIPYHPGSPASCPSAPLSLPPTLVLFLSPQSWRTLAAYYTRSPNCQQQEWFPHLEGSEVRHPRAGQVAFQQEGAVLHPGEVTPLRVGG